MVGLDTITKYNMVLADKHDPKPLNVEEKRYSHNVELSVVSAPSKREEILQTYQHTSALYEQLFDILEDDAFFVRADPLRHPLIFYYGHTSVFAINKLVLAKLLPHSNRVCPKIESLLAVGVDEMSWDDLLPDSYEWPSIDRVRWYRKLVQEIVSQLILSESDIPLQDNSRITWEHPFWPILMILEHERIHLETSAVLIRQLPLSSFKEVLPSSPFYGTCPHLSSTCPDSIPSVSKYTEQTVKLGKDLLSTSFYGWDNEFGSEEMLVPSFSADTCLITNGQFLEFVKDDGYNNSEFWSKEGWKWKEYAQPSHPRFWVSSSESIPHQYIVRTLFQLTSSFPTDWPVEVNYLEAFAYCQWYTLKTGTSTRLPTEAEYYLMEKNHTDNNTNTNHNIGMEMWASSSPVQCNEFIGNVWEWTRTTMYPYEGFRVHPLYDDFTAPTFNDLHNLVKGGSWISCGNQSLVGSRYAFRRHFYQFAGFRLVYPNPLEECSASNDSHNDIQLMNCKRFPGESKDGEDTSSNPNPYESDVSVNMYCDFHYTPIASTFASSLDSFPVVCARLCEALVRYHGPSRSNDTPTSVLDLGCAVGRTSLELATFFDRVVGVDFSARFVQTAYTMLKNGKIRYKVPTEGDLTCFREAVLFSEGIPLNGEDCLSLVNGLFPARTHSLPPLSLPKLSDKVTFLQGDACNLSFRKGISPFTCVLCCNLIDRLYDPSAFLSSIGSHIVQGGLLVLLSPYTWLEEYTRKDNWVGGKKVDGESRWTQEGLELQLGEAGFERVLVRPQGSSWKDCHGSVVTGEFSAEEDQGLVKSFHVPFLIRETHRKFQYTFSECTVWKKL